MSTEGSSRSSSISADSYIGSWISLTSKSEIRYEGILYNINTDESSIGLRNVRSYGSEGRKKDALQVPPSDKVFEYILFRGSDIKDLQVKSSPPVQPASSINNDPAIIQSHYSRPPSTSTSFPSAVSGPITDISSHTAQLGLHGSNFQGSPSLFQPGGNLGSWSPSPSLSSANGSGLAMPMYWQGFYGHPNGLPHLQQQSLLRSQPGLPMPLQQPMQFSGFNSSLPTGTSNLSGAGLLEVPSSFVPTNPSAPNLASPLLPPSALLSAFPPVLPGSLLSDSITNNNQNSSPSTATLCTSLPTLSSLTTMASDLSAVVPPLSNKPNAIGSTLPYQSLPQNSSSAIGAPSTTFTEAPTPTPTLVTPGQLVQFGSSTASSSQTSQTAHKDVEVVRVSSLAPSEPPLAVPVDTKAPILPLPTPPRPLQKPNGAHFDTRHDYRGRGRGRGGGRSRPVTRFTEDFDFTAMNEKFKKDEVWGHLGKSSGSQSEYREGGGKASYEEDFQNEDDSELAKPTYNKDDFFDTLSCNALDRNSNSGRTNFSEQRKIDTETFGEFSTYRGGRGPYRGGRSRGSYYGRGYGYFNRGRGGRGVARQGWYFKCCDG